LRSFVGWYLPAVIVLIAKVNVETKSRVPTFFSTRDVRATIFTVWPAIVIAKVNIETKSRVPTFFTRELPSSLSGRHQSSSSSLSV
jgi:hypothetical protein